MRISTWLALPLLASFGCGETEIPTGQVYFTPGAEPSSLKSVVASYVVERIDTAGNSTTLFEGETLPITIDMGTSGVYRFRATGKDAAGNVVARGETVPQDVHTLAAVQIPLFMARTDRTSIADNQFDIVPGEYPKVGVVGNSALWMFTQPNEDLATDAYNFSYWQQVTPEGLSNISCTGGCDLQTLAMVGGTIAFVVGNTQMLWADEYAELVGTFPLPEGLDSYSSLAGGRALPGANYTSVVVGATRKGTPTSYAMAFSISSASEVVGTVSRLASARAEAAALFEVGFGLVVAGGSAEGVGVERMLPGETEFRPVNYPADPVTGAALVVKDATHLQLLRVGGLNPDGSPAATVSIDVSCALDLCTPEPLVDTPPLGIVNAQAFLDAESGESIIAGENADGLTELYRYAPQSNQFTAISIPTNQERVHATAVRLPGRKVALVGGVAPDGTAADRMFLSVVSY
jgi:hypothetical protein